VEESQQNVHEEVEASAWVSTSYLPTVNDYMIHDTHKKVERIAKLRMSEILGKAFIYNSRIVYISN
jgi:hypothetical protein